MAYLAEKTRLQQCLIEAELEIRNIWHGLCVLEKFVGNYKAFSDTPEYDLCLEKIDDLTAAITELEMANVCALPPVITSIIALYM